MRRCIFHFPEPIIENPTSGSAVRPNRMLQAFRDIGYQVDEATGYSGDRKAEIQKIKQNIKNGVHYDFVYSESVNSPTLMADKDHIPRHPFMDFSFLKFCKNNGIPVLLFLRDIHWRFPTLYNPNVALWKRMILIPANTYDLHKYKSCVDLMYYPTEAMQKHVRLQLPFKALPPGGELQENSLEIRKHRVPLQDGKLRLFYVGSISNDYDIQKLVKATYQCADVYLTICTHKSQWEKYRSYYEPYLCDRIQIIHKTSKELAPYYENSDMSTFCVSEHPYMDIAIPIKTMESVGYGTPILATNLVSLSEMINDEQVGWVAENSVEGILQQLEYLKTHPEKIREKTNSTIKAAYRNTWEARARQVAEDAQNVK